MLHKEIEGIIDVIAMLGGLLGMKFLVCEVECLIVFGKMVKAAATVTFDRLNNIDRKDGKIIDERVQQLIPARSSMADFQSFRAGNSTMNPCAEKKQVSTCWFATRTRTVWM